MKASGGAGEGPGTREVSGKLPGAAMSLCLSSLIPERSTGARSFQTKYKERWSYQVGIYQLNAVSPKTKFQSALHNL